MTLTYILITMVVCMMLYDIAVNKNEDEPKI